ncbi:hypothetical protein ES703_89775 [subsurface metagenome]
MTKTYDTPFIMPANDVTILVWVERWRFDHWEYDNSDSKVVSLAVPAPPPPPPPCSISISAPDSAQQGETVNLSTVITNNSPYAQLYKTEMYANAEFIGSIEATIPGYSSRTYGGSFVMPADDVTILVWVERWKFDHWEYDNSDSKVVSLAVPAPPELAWLYTDVVGEGRIEREPPDNAFPIGTVVTLTAIPDSGYRFFEWRGDLSGISPTKSIIMDEDKYVTALFELIPAPPPPPAEPEFRGFAVKEYTRG